MKLNDKIIFLYQLTESSDSQVVKDFDEISGLDEYKKIVDSISTIKENLLNTDCFMNVLKVVMNLDIIETYVNLLKQPIHINQFQDKYGNQYLQARTSMKVYDKKVWVNAYVGKLTDYPKGIEDPNALEKGKIMVRKKLIENYLSCFNPK